MKTRIAWVRSSSGYFFLSYVSLFLLSVVLDIDVFSWPIRADVLARAAISSVILWYVLYLSAFSRIVNIAVLVLLAILLTVKIYYVHVLGVHIEPAVFEGMFDTSPDEAARLGSAKPLVIFFAAVLYLAVAIEFGWLRRKPFRRRVLVHSFKWLAVVSLIFAYSASTSEQPVARAESLLEEAFPVRLTQRFAEAVTARYRLYLANKSKVDPAVEYSFHWHDDRPVTVVFVRGESLRQRSFPLEDDEIGEPNRLPGVGEYVHFRHVFSYANYTQAAVPWMLSRSVEDRLLNERSFISVLRKLGFDTTWLGCDNSNIASFATPVVNYSVEADRSLFTGKLHDWVASLPEEAVARRVGAYFNDAWQFAYLLSSLDDPSEEPRFFWVEMNGSHVPWRGFADAYVFGRPLCDKVLDEVMSCSETEAVNSYNSTVLATQHALRLLILQLQHRNAIVFFAADHGESTGERGLYGHGFMLPEGDRWIRDQVNPAFMIWMSDEFAARHPGKLRALRENARHYARHDVIFHSVLDGLGIESEVVDKRKSVFAEEFEARSPFVEYRYRVQGGEVLQADYNRLVFASRKSDAGADAVLRLEFDPDEQAIQLTLSTVTPLSTAGGDVAYELWQGGERLATGFIAEGGVSHRIDLRKAHQVELRRPASGRGGLDVSAAGIRIDLRKDGESGK